MKQIIAAALIAVSIGTAASAGTLVTTDTGYAGPGLNLGAFANGSYNFTFGPIAVDSFTFTSVNGGGNSGKGSVVGQGSYGLNANGSFGGSATYIGVDSPTGYAQLLGKTAYSQIGFFMNYAPGSGNDATISTLDAAGNVIQAYDLVTLAPISTPGAMNAFSFRGVVDTTADIYGLRFGGDYLLVTGTANGAVTGGVPEPANWALMMTGFALVGTAARRRRTAIAA